LTRSRRSCRVRIANATASCSATSRRRSCVPRWRVRAAPRRLPSTRRPHRRISIWHAAGVRSSRLGSGWARRTSRPRRTSTRTPFRTPRSTGSSWGAVPVMPRPVPAARKAQLWQGFCGQMEDIGIEHRGVSHRAKSLQTAFRYSTPRTPRTHRCMHRCVHGPRGTQSGAGSLGMPATRVHRAGVGHRSARCVAGHWASGPGRPGEGRRSDARRSGVAGWDDGPRLGIGCRAGYPIDAGASSWEVWSSR